MTPQTVLGGVRVVGREPSEATLVVLDTRDRVQQSVQQLGRNRAAERATKRV